MYARSYGQPPYGREIDGTADLLLQMADKLQEYECLEEQGKLLKLPCAVGDTVYTIYSDEYGSLIEEGEVLEVSTQRIWIDSAYFDDDDIGKTVFLTRKEAENSIKGIRKSGGIGEMREILFRGKRTDNGEWVEGYYFEFKGRAYIINISQTFMSVYYTEESIVDFNMRAFEVDMKTVCQYTSLTDKNGRKIFEGDIINDIDYGIMKCIYLHGSFVWYKEDGFRIECMTYVPVIEVIGNIFDNPELIGE